MPPARTNGTTGASECGRDERPSRLEADEGPRRATIELRRIDTVIRRPRVRGRRGVALEQPAEVNDPDALAKGAPDPVPALCFRGGSQR
jgi:hypothetical protein